MAIENLKTGGNDSEGILGTAIGRKIAGELGINLGNKKLAHYINEVYKDLCGHVTYFEKDTIKKMIKGVHKNYIKKSK